MCAVMSGYPALAPVDRQTHLREQIGDMLKLKTFTVVCETNMEHQIELD